VCKKFSKSSLADNSQYWIGDILYDPQCHADSRGFAGAIGAEKAEYLTFKNAQVDSIYRYYASKLLS